MPASSPWLDQLAPAQWSQGEPVAEGSIGAAVNDTSFDTTLHWKVAGTIIAALIVIFGLRALGFRFVVTAGVGG